MTSTRPAPGTWALDPSATTVVVSARKLGLFTIPATLNVVSGTIEVGEDHEITSVEVVADASSYASKNAKRNEHVISPDFLDAGAHPTIVFRSEGVADATDGVVSHGTVTVKGQDAQIEVVVANIDVADDAGSFVATATVDRNAIGVGRMPSAIIGRQLDITVSATAGRRA
ncbi:MAG: YceI family protein [Actinomycetota bacterium]